VHPGCTSEIKYLKERTPEKQFGQSESRAVQSPCKNTWFRRDPQVLDWK
jgi:hypothetical protein